MPADPIEIAVGEIMEVVEEIIEDFNFSDSERIELFARIKEQLDKSFAGNGAGE